MRIAILGYGLQGKSSLAYWSKRPGNEITICDGNTKIEVSESVGIKLGKDYLKNLDEFDLIVRSPSVHPKDIAKANSPKILDKVTTNTNEFFKVCPTRNIIGVTGTKGKGTTSSLIADMLKSAGKTVHLGGNIGTPPLDLLADVIGKQNWVVLELANFQLTDIKHSPKIAVCLMVAEEHLDWHGDPREYFTAKKQLFTHQNREDFAIFYAKNKDSKAIASAGKGQKIPYYTPPGAIIENDDVVIDGQSICSTDEIQLLGEHNWQNVCAAVTAVWQITKEAEALHSAIANFKGLEHRLEFVREVSGVKYYDDSFGTTPETAIVAIKAFDEPKVLILGGSDKGAKFDELAKTVKESSVRRAVLIGQTAPKIKAALKRAGFTDYIEGRGGMPSIVGQCKKAAQPGDVVLLSTACASFGQFKDYQDRGQQFKAAVAGLA